MASVILFLNANNNNSNTAKITDRMIPEEGRTRLSRSIMFVTNLRLEENFQDRHLWYLTQIYTSTERMIPGKGENIPGVPKKCTDFTMSYPQKY